MSRFWCNSFQIVIRQDLIRQKSPRECTQQLDKVARRSDELQCKNAKITNRLGYTPFYILYGYASFKNFKNQIGILGTRYN